MKYLYILALTVFSFSLTAEHILNKDLKKYIKREAELLGLEGDFRPYFIKGKEDPIKFRFDNQELNINYIQSDQEYLIVNGSKYTIPVAINSEDFTIRKRLKLGFNSNRVYKLDLMENSYLVLLSDIRGVSQYITSMIILDLNDSGKIINYLSLFNYEPRIELLGNSKLGLYITKNYSELFDTWETNIYELNIDFFSNKKIDDSGQPYLILHSWSKHFPKRLIVEKKNVFN